MKTRIIHIILSLILMIVFSCEKDWQETEKDQPENETKVLSEMDQYLLDFRRQMDNPLKSGELLELEDACWHLSATLNFSYADSKSGYEFLPTDTLIFYLPLNYGQVGMQAFSNAFYEVTSFLSDRYHEIEAGDKILLLVSVSITAQTDHEAELMAVSMMGYNSGLSWGYPFSEGHWWYWGFELGRCAAYEGQNMGSDAAKRLTFATNITVPIPGPGRVYWEDPVTEIIYPDQHPDTNSPCGYMLLLSDIPWQQAPYCMPPDELDYYFTNILSFGQQFKPENKSLIGYFVDGTIFMYNYLSYPAHVLNVTYGVPHVTPELPNEL